MRTFGLGLALAASDVATIRAAELDRAIDHRLQHGIKVERSARDRLDHVVGCRRPVIGPLQLTPESRDLLLKRVELTHVTDPCGHGVLAR